MTMFSQKQQEKGKEEKKSHGLCWIVCKGFVCTRQFVVKHFTFQLQWDWCVVRLSLRFLWHEFECRSKEQWKIFWSRCDLCWAHSCCQSSPHEGQTDRHFILLQPMNVLRFVVYFRYHCFFTVVLCFVIVLVVLVVDFSHDSSGTFPGTPKVNQKYNNSIK